MKQLIPILLLVFLIVEFYSYQAVKTLTYSRWIRFSWIAVSVLVWAVILYFVFHMDRSNKYLVQFIAGLFVTVFATKLVLGSVLLLEDVVRMGSFVFQKIFSSSEAHFPARRKFISITALGLAAIPFLSVLNGIIRGKYDFTLRKVKLSFPDLPDEFDGYKIVQLSDIHLGSFNEKNSKKIAAGIDLVNSQNADLFLFTGDSVNFYAEEMDFWLPLLEKIEAKDGKYSILGNHDYGMYAFGDNLTAQQENVEKLYQKHQKIGWKMLRNQSVQINGNNSHINIVGVENWGLPPFPQRGDLEKASQNIPNGEFNILMSHDPSHFDAKVKEFEKKMHLTLSGHTHGMQFGVEIPNVIKWSPVKYKYPKWAGLYEEKGKYLYVNRGFGFIGFPGRVGILPEVTLIELRKS
ncbi:MAG: metallophosphoesterase [Flavobacteriaceae bacterium]|jgi:predicted MPP superfamily phosphohydrolase|nr:metallophosphoesterase [Flavobacteriaceae bacterium]